MLLHVKARGARPPDIYSVAIIPGRHPYPTGHATRSASSGQSRPLFRVIPIVPGKVYVGERLRGREGAQVREDWAISAGGM